MATQLAFRERSTPVDELGVVIDDLGAALNAEQVAHRRLVMLARRVAARGERQRDAFA